jgi:signal transduction histidine kinase
VLSASVVEDGDIAISVSDTGIGMEPDEIPIALEPFRQLEGAFNRRFEGTGLGLPLVRRLAELHGGTLTITSAKGRGTVAIVRLPSHRVRRKPSQAKLATLRIVGADARATIAS